MFLTVRVEYLDLESIKWKYNKHIDSCDTNTNSIHPKIQFNMEFAIDMKVICLNTLITIYS